MSQPKFGVGLTTELISAAVFKENTGRVSANQHFPALRGFLLKVTLFVIAFALEKSFILHVGLITLFS